MSDTTASPGSVLDYPRGVTFEEVWAAMKETDRRMKETARQMQATDRQIKRIGKQMGEPHNRFGRLAEHLVAPGIVRRFNELGFHFQGIAANGYTLPAEDRKRIRTEIDILLENGDYIIAVEVKSSPTQGDVEHHINRLKILREARDRVHDSRKIRDAIAGAIFPQKVKDMTLEAGLYVIEQTGDTMRVDVPGGFIPNEW